jgi:putative membrane protein
MLAVGLVLTGVGALFHVYVFYLESVAWTTPRGRAVFGLSREEAETTRLLALNQGFYNLFLAAMVIVGTALVLLDRPTVGVTLVMAGSAAMVAAGCVLVASDRSKARAAAAQAVPPALGIIAVAISLAA